MEALKYKEKMVNRVKEGKLGRAYSAVGVNNARETFEISSFVDQGFSDRQAADHLADHFSRISQEFDPINIDLFAPNLRYKLKRGWLDQTGPILDELKVYLKIMNAKKPKLSVKGDLKVPLIENFDVELAEPVSMIFNYITCTQAGIGETLEKVSVSTTFAQSRSVSVSTTPNFLLSKSLSLDKLPIPGLR